MPSYVGSEARTAGVPPAHDHEARGDARGPEDHERAGRPRCVYDYFAHGPNGGMSLLGLSGKAGGRFSKNDLMPSCASAPAAR